LIDIMALELLLDAFESDAWVKLKSLIGEREIIGHNIVTFDFPYLFQHFGITASNITDTKGVHRILMNGIPDVTHDLKSVLEEVGICLPKTEAIVIGDRQHCHRSNLRTPQTMFF